MSPHDLISLQDLYLTLDEEQSKPRATYILQTLWRFLTSDLDIMGPYYPSDGTFNAKNMLACVLDTMRKFHMYDFKVNVLFCDGASTNLFMIKL